MKKRHILLLMLAVSLLLCSCGEVKIESITLSKNAAELKEGENITLSAVCRAGERNGELRLEIRGRERCNGG